MSSVCLFVAVVDRSPVPGNVVSARSCGNVEIINNKIVPPEPVMGIMGKRGLPPAAPSAGADLIYIDPGLPGISVVGNGTNVVF